MRLVLSPDAREILPESAAHASIVGSNDGSAMITSGDYLAFRYFAARH
jgi:hypothetical protein